MYLACFFDEAFVEHILSFSQHCVLIESGPCLVVGCLFDGDCLESSQRRHVGFVVQVCMDGQGVFFKIQI